jgi:heparosan-N-sulfate-glucuronate 5-epimerase
MSNHTRARRTSRRSEPDLLRRAGSLVLPVGPRLARGAVSGYAIDLRVKAGDPGWSQGGTIVDGGRRATVGSGAHGGQVRAERLIYVSYVQWGLGCFERYLASEGEVWLRGALQAGRYLVANQERAGRYEGGWVHRFACPHTYPLRGPWVSAMAQGEAASLLVRLYEVTRDAVFAETALQALRPLRVSVAAGGTRASLGGGPFLEEYPTDPPSLVLNGAFFALWGLHDVGVALNDRKAAGEFVAGVDVLARELHRWDTGFWSRYDLYPHRIVNVANPFYHRLHINLLRAMQVLAPRTQFDVMIERFEAYNGLARNVSRAYAHKLLFRLLSPRNATLRRAFPWAPELRQ